MKIFLASDSANMSMAAPFDLRGRPRSHRRSLFSASAMLPGTSLVDINLLEGPYQFLFQVVAVLPWIPCVEGS